MKVLLLKSIQGIGGVGDIVEVSDPQARNFLIPKKLAVVATGAVIKAQARNIARQNDQRAQHQSALTLLIAKLEQHPLRLTGKANQQGKLFAAVKTSDIQTALEHEHHLKLGHLTCLPDHLKNIGTHQVRININHQQADITIIIDHAS